MDPGDKLAKAMREIQIAFFDIDGTLVDMDWKKMTETMRQTLITLHEKGILLVIATGRPPFRVPVFEGVSFDAYMTFNGSYCYDSRGILIHSHAIPSADAEKIVRNAARIHHPCVAAGRDRLVCNGADQNLIDYFAISKQALKKSDDFDSFLEKEEVYQIMCGCVREEYDSVLKGVKGAEITAWWPRAVDIIPKGSGKNIGVEKILSFFHLSRDQAIAFGDGGNDIPMLKSVGMGVAMGNSTDEVRNAASYVCPSVKEEGITQFFRELNIL